MRPAPSPEARQAMEEARHALADIAAVQPLAEHLAGEVRRVVAENQLVDVVERTLRRASQRATLPKGT